MWASGFGIAAAIGTEVIRWSSRPSCTQELFTQPQKYYLHFITCFFFVFRKGKLKRIAITVATIFNVFVLF